MYGIICLKDGDSSIPIPIVDSEDDGGMATWDTLDEARAFALDHILCQISVVMFIDLENGEVDY